jgi:hypothetical protein
MVDVRLLFALSTLTDPYLTVVTCLSYIPSQIHVSMHIAHEARDLPENDRLPVPSYHMSDQYS